MESPWSWPVSAPRARDGDGPVATFSLRWPLRTRGRRGAGRSMPLKRRRGADESYVLLTLADFLAGLLRGSRSWGSRWRWRGRLGPRRAGSAGAEGRSRPVAAVSPWSRWARWPWRSVKACSCCWGAYVLSMTLGRNPLADFVHDHVLRSWVVRTLVALALAATAVRLRAAPVANGWAVVSVLAGAIVLCGAWLTHALGRPESRAVLVALTVTHQLGAAIWIGGLVQLAALCGWRGATLISTPPGQSWYAASPAWQRRPSWCSSSRPFRSPGATWKLAGPRRHRYARFFSSGIAAGAGARAGRIESAYGVDSIAWTARSPEAAIADPRRGRDHRTHRRPVHGGKPVRPPARGRPAPRIRPP